LQTIFIVTQHGRDRILLNRIRSVLDWGSIQDVGRNAFDLRVAGLSPFTGKIVPFFECYPLSGAKKLDFLDFSKGISIMNSHGHLTKTGLAQ
jgi:hypothetical protein